jgi:ATP-binding cassette subfamily B protein
MDKDRDRSINRLLHPYRWTLAFIVAIQVLGAIAQVEAITILKPMINIAVNEGDLNEILAMGAYLLLFTFISLAVIAVTSFLASKVASGVSNELRMRIMRATLEMQDMSRLGNTSTLAMSSLTTDVTIVEKFILELLRTYLPMPFLLALLFYFTFDINDTVGLILLIMMVAITIVTLLLSKRIQHLYNLQITAQDRVNNLLKEKVTGARTIRAFNGMEHEIGRFGEASTEFGGFNRRLLMNSYYLPHIATAVMWIFVIFIFLDSALSGTGKIIPEEIIIFMQYATTMIATLTIIPYLSVEEPRARICFDRIRSIIAAGKKSKSVIYMDSPADPDTPMVEVKDMVKVDTRGNHILNGIDLTIARGEKVTMVGMNGSGATELFSIAMGFSAPDSGEMHIAGLKVGRANPSRIRSVVSYAGNNMSVMRGTVRFNLDPKGEHSDEEIMALCDRIGIGKFISGLPGGLDHAITSDSSSMSGGQRLQMILVRCLLHDSDLYIFDDCFFSLDQVTKGKVLSTIMDVCRDKAVVFIMHDVSTCMVSDRIILMDRGRIQDSGTHEELLSRSQLYKDICSVGQRRNGTWA